MKNNGCIITELADGEFNGIDIFEINEIPDISILIRESSEEKDFSQRHKKEFETRGFFLKIKPDEQIPADRVLVERSENFAVKKSGNSGV